MRFSRILSFIAVLCAGLCQVSVATVNYADVRARLVYGFAEKANEMHDMISLLQDVSKESAALLDKISRQCGQPVA
eukprot:CAMPEP_0179210966 /NCGR_PEP_ID=MMETSP0797-20121207/96_1 /TAXON_ID=47934 /ORGANISM="Dinophysis acuminata, Strain DAEP01" /LENGTH=75 /DNA_ID=CAMNT_0020916031 /DNA_START=73 /DNA_END=300 /DNA_ORIENTATION=-